MTCKLIKHINKQIFNPEFLYDFENLRQWRATLWHCCCFCFVYHIKLAYTCVYHIL